MLSNDFIGTRKFWKFPDVSLNSQEDPECWDPVYVCVFHSSFHSQNNKSRQFQTTELFSRLHLPAFQLRNMPLAKAFTLYLIWKQKISSKSNKKGFTLDCQKNSWKKGTYIKKRNWSILSQPICLRKEPSFVAQWKVQFSQKPFKMNASCRRVTNMGLY